MGHNTSKRWKLHGILVGKCEGNRQLGIYWHRDATILRQILTLRKPQAD
jgi:hypothetical protein